MKSLIVAIAVLCLLAFVPAAIACPPVAVSSLGVQSHCNAVAVQSLAVQPVAAVAYTSPVVINGFSAFSANHHYGVNAFAFGGHGGAVVLNNHQAQVGLLGSLVDRVQSRAGALRGRRQAQARARAQAAQLRALGY